MSDSAADSGSSFVTVSFSPDPGFTLVFDGMIVTEELGRPFLIDVDLSSGKGQGGLEKMLGSTATITMIDGAGAKTYFNGFVGRMLFVGMSGGVYRYKAELRPWIWLLGHTQDCKIFQNKSAWDIIQQVFSDNGFSAISDKRQNQAGSTVLDYCVQYRETSLDFVTRLMEQFGLYYYFTHTSSEHTLVIADDPNSHTSIGAAIPYMFGQTEQRAVQEHVWEWTSDLCFRPGTYSYTDYNFTTPSADLTAKSVQAGAHPHGSYEVYDYPGVYAVAADGQKLADVRMQDFKSRVQVFEGRTNARAVRSGVKVTLSGTVDTALAQEYTAVQAITTISMAEGGSDSRGQLVDSYRVNFTAITGSTPFRLELRTPKPMIRGPQTALVVGNSGEEITTDQYGRIKVQFYWDRVGTKNQDSSCWIRVAQTWAGAGWGAMFIPRIGMEVVVGFLEGNPDRPLVTGVVYNATQTVPYPLPDNATRSTVKTNSSKGGGGFNEWRLEDKKGSEEIFMQAQKDYNWNVLNNETGIVTQDQSITVQKGNRSITVSQGNETTTISQGNRSATVTQGNDSTTVSQGNRSVTVSLGSDSTTVSAGNHSLAVSAGGSKTTTGQAFEVTADTQIKLTATAGITLTCGPCSISISPSGISISGPQIQASADASMSLSGGGSMSLTAGMISIN